MSQNSKPVTPSTQAAEPVDPVTRAAAAKALMEELSRKTQHVIHNNPDVLKGVPGGISGVNPK